MSDTMPVVDFDKAFKLFTVLDKKGRERLLSASKEMEFDADSTLCKEGECGEVFWFILEGTAAVMVEDIQGDKEVALLKRGQFFGEISVVLGQPRSATVIAKTHLRLLSFERAAVMMVLEDYPKVRELLGQVGVMRSEDTLLKLMSD